MVREQPVAKEVVIKEHPRSTYWLEGKQVRAVGNLILTNERLVFVRQAALSEKQAEELKGLGQEATTSESIQFALRLHKKNFQLPLSSIVAVKMGFLSFFPLRPCLRVYYHSASKNINTLSFLFTLPLLKRLLMTEFPTIGWTGAIKKAVKAKKLPVTVQH